MKKPVTIFVLVAYFIVSSGFVVNLHYCMDRLHSWELGSNTSERCDTCGMKLKQQKNKCCHDELKMVKLQHDAAAAKLVAYSFAVAAEATAFPSIYLAPAVVLQPRPAAPATGPPLLSAQDTYLRNCVFRI